MLLWIRILSTVLFSILATILLFNVKNQSNLSPYIIIPLLVALLTKYSIGDWDKGFQWSTLDISYWICIIGSSYGVIYVLS
jgi:hypothetical protein